MRNSLPVNVRPRIYTIFIGNTVVQLNHVIHTVKFIYDILVEWSKKHHKFMQRKYEVTNIPLLSLFQKKLLFHFTEVFTESG